MADMRIRVDDFLNARHNKMVAADKKIKVTIPAYATDTGRAVNIAFDVSDKGEAEIKKMVQQAEESIEALEAGIEKRRREAWEPLLKLREQREAAMHRSRPKNKKQSDRDHASAASENANTPGEDARTVTETGEPATTPDAGVETSVYEPAPAPEGAYYNPDNFTYYNAENRQPYARFAPETGEYIDL